MDAADQKMRLAQVAKQIAACSDCGLCRGRNRTVPGEGNPAAQIMFIGEGPGFYEDQQGRPFVGAAGKFLDELLAGIGLDRKKVFIANVVKCRPPSNRDPQPDEIEACGKHLASQIDIIDPKVIVTLGRFSMQRYFPGESISRIHGTPRRKGEQIIVPMYHPAAALHQGSLRRVIESDFARLPGFLEKILAGDTPVVEKTEVPAHLRKDAPTSPAQSQPAPAPATAAQQAEEQSQQMRLL